VSAPRIVIAAGGTAGHVVPAIAVADALRAEGAEVSFVGGQRAEAELVPAAGYPLDPIRVEGISRSNPVKAARALGKAMYSLIGEAVERGFEARWAELRQRVDHLLTFDAWLFSTPMWNFGLPYRLKHYIDLIIQPTMAFTNDAEGAINTHGDGKIAILIGAGALDIRPGAALAALDFGLAHLAQCLRVYFGVREIHEIRVVPTFGDEASVERAMAAARTDTEALAISLAGRAGGRG